MSEVIITNKVHATIHRWHSDDIVRLIGQALRVEVRLTPKPGLVDIRNTGAHKDMDLALFESSTLAIVPWMARFWEMGFNTAKTPAHQILPMIRPLGLACESDMLNATHGVNTHRGAVFAFGLLSAAIGRISAQGAPLEQNRICEQVARFCLNLVQQELACAIGSHSGRGMLHFLRYGLTGARGEAQSGFQTVRTLALPVLNQMNHAQRDMNLALLQTFIHLMAWNEDTNLVTRGGLEGLYFVQHQAQQLLWRGGVMAADGLTALCALDDELIARNLSPGGSADLLAVTWFLSHFPPGPFAA